MTVAARVRGRNAGSAFSLASLGLDLALESTDITGKVDDNAISLWTGSAGSAAQATGAKQPLYKTNILNGLPVLRFDGGDDFMTSTFATDSNAGTLVVVGKFRSTATTNRIIGFAGSYGIYSNGNTWAWYAPSSDFGAGAGSFCVVTVKFESTVVAKPRVNGVAGTTFSADMSPDSSYALALGAHGQDGGECGPVDIAAVYADATALPDADVQALERYAGTKFGITVA